MLEAAAVPLVWQLGACSGPPRSMAGQGQNPGLGAPSPSFTDQLCCRPGMCLGDGKSDMAGASWRMRLYCLVLAPGHGGSGSLQAAGRPGGKPAEGQGDLFRGRPALSEGTDSSHCCCGSHATWGLVPLRNQASGASDGGTDCLAGRSPGRRSCSAPRSVLNLAVGCSCSHCSRALTDAALPPGPRPPAVPVLQPTDPCAPLARPSGGPSSWPCCLASLISVTLPSGGHHPLALLRFTSFPVWLMHSLCFLRRLSYLSVPTGSQSQFMVYT